MVLFMLTFVACDDKDSTFTDIDGDRDGDGDVRIEDTGTVDPDEPVVIDYDCYYQSASVPFDLNDDGSMETCSTQKAISTGTSAIEMVGGRVRDATIQGYTDSAIPDLTEQVRVWVLRMPEPWDTGDPGRAYPFDQDYSAYTVAQEIGTSGQWYAWFEGELVGDLNHSAPDVDWYTVGTEIQDTSAAMSDNCGIYDSSDSSTDTSDLAVCVAAEFYSGEPAPPPDASCTSGHGRFGLVPMWQQDKDGDGFLAVRWKPLMESGHGLMTGDAVVSKVRVVDDHDIPLRVMHTDKWYSFGDDDSLVADRRASSLVSDARRATTITGGKVHGGAPFVSERYPKDEALDLEVDITWTCTLAAARGAPAEELPQAYSATLGDLGCETYAAQRFTIRPYPAANPVAVEVGLSGDSTHTIMVPLAYNEVFDSETGEQVDRWFFTYANHGVHVVGSLGQHDAEGVDVTLDTVEVLGTTQCAPGSYVIPKAM